MQASKYYEAVGDALEGAQALRAYRKAQNLLPAHELFYFTAWKRLQGKIIKSY